MSYSESLFTRAQKNIPGGVNSPVRAFKAVGGNPLYMIRGQGSKMYSVEGKEYVDFCSSWGPLILGHSHPAIVEAVCLAARKGMSFGTTTPEEVELADLICSLVPAIEMVRLVNSGTEAVMTAIRLARAFTKRDKIIKFDGCYHGHTDAMLVSAGSGLLTGGISSSAGVPQKTAEDIFIAPYNDIAKVNEIIDAQGDQIAAIIVEPIAGNMGLVMHQPGFLEGLRVAADKCGCVLIFDEVITGFRLGPTSYGSIIGIKPDITTLGKIIGGGMPIGAVGGRKEIMEQLAPLGAVYQAGTLSGNPVAVSAGITMLKLLQKLNPYDRMAIMTTDLVTRLQTSAQKNGQIVTIVQKGSLFTVYFCENEPRNLIEVKKCDTVQFAKFFRSMIDSGIYLPPSQFEAAFISMVHTETDIDLFVNAAEKFFASEVKV